MGNERNRKRNSRRRHFNRRKKFERYGWHKDCGVYCYEREEFTGTVIRGTDNKGRAIFSYSIDSSASGYGGVRLSLEDALSMVELEIAKKCKGGLCNNCGACYKAGMLIPKDKSYPCITMQCAYCFEWKLHPVRES